MQLNSNWNVDCLLIAKVRLWLLCFGGYFSNQLEAIFVKKFSWKLEKMVRKKIKRSLIWNFLLLLRRPHLRRTPEMEMATIFHENIFLLCCTSWQKKIFSCFCKKKLQRVCVYKILKYKTEMFEKLWYCPGGSSICWAQNICLSCRCNPQ